MIAIAAELITKAEKSSQIRIVEGDALDTIAVLHGPFDIIFIDSDKKDYIDYFDTIMERKLLAQDGIIVADNVLARGSTVDSNANNAKDSAELRKFNDHIAKDDRVDVCVLPMFDGLALIKWRPNMYPLQRVHSHLSINGFVTNGTRPRSIHRGSFDPHSQRSPSRNSYELSRTGTPSFHTRRLSQDYEIEEKDEFSYGFSNRRNSCDEDEDEEPSMFGKKLDHHPHRNQFIHTVSGFESHNKYYD